MLPYSGHVNPDPYALATEAAEHVRTALGIESADLALVLGSGWKEATDRLGDPIGRIDLAELPGFHAPVVAGHGGELIAFGTAAGKTALVFTGRTHLYEGRGVDAVVHGVRTAAALGVQTLVLTNGCGGLDPAIAPGTPVIIRDHLNLTGETPLRGATFIDMSTTWTPRLVEVAQSVDPTLTTGVYVQFRGPQYETPAEVRMAGVIGGTLVGMSTTLEAIAAREAGLDLLGLSLVTNAAAGVTDAPLDHHEVIEAGRAAGPRLAGLVADLVAVL
ncbi:purine-nucleoside phosphorylase [Aestuariimicrobium ganziense]|uniref:purine-nucleoside phosphorylase n=1 Tax=Aestuariimicrobium ganziense TaxID=2773677 RepID=UPI001943248F|nr:purine-nucleoside phosphorylase [Aestuariimicrobium ganziense]